ncbi:hypothetical protein SODALDRAFT_354636 [Sodiomyces alkalinus F11]|uniref:Uncharacterized protein n=1 Tax=Sodiomyces alkalinus (strain CBS 110278 / VKM F-3762 / F11) TaxID=1314773 RepID=A0A3N2Q6S9_SODAK|nr:hypothetical protein SODALDRAFT_354636 [Sodiomyces alkalinus F11]ROT42481.1 hypothetical protein SODALDRAFT_354636 [Sodiomyces alkalinus F11]
MLPSHHIACKPAGHRSASDDFHGISYATMLDLATVLGQMLGGGEWTRKRASLAVSIFIGIWRARKLTLEFLIYEGRSRQKVYLDLLRSIGPFFWGPVSIQIVLIIGSSTQFAPGPAQKLLEIQTTNRRYYTGTPEIGDFLFGARTSQHTLLSSSHNKTLP